MTPAALLESRSPSCPPTVQFGKAAAAAELQYCEEPVARPSDLPEFHRRTGMAVALDESVDEGEAEGGREGGVRSREEGGRRAASQLVLSQALAGVCMGVYTAQAGSLPPAPRTEGPLCLPICAGLVGPGAPDAEALCEGAAALVLKPAVLGGFERTAQLAAWAAQRGMHAVVSSAFESSLGLSQLAQLAAALEAAPGAQATQHGLATLTWFAEDLLPAAASAQLLQPDSAGDGVALSMEAAQAVGSSAVALALGLDQQASGAVPQPQLQRRSCSVQTAGASYAFGLLEAVPVEASSGSSGNGSGSKGDQPPVLLLHGFMGAADDWRPLMQSLGLQRRCVALDLPGHGGTAVVATSGANDISSSTGGTGSSGQEAYSLEAAADAVAALVQQEGLAGCRLVGYSLGARLALLLAARWPHLFSAVVSVSGGQLGFGQAGMCPPRSDAALCTLAELHHPQAFNKPSQLGLELPLCSVHAPPACQTQLPALSAPHATTPWLPRCAPAACLLFWSTGTSSRCGRCCAPAPGEQLLGGVLVPAVCAGCGPPRRQCRLSWRRFRLALCSSQPCSSQPRRPACPQTPASRHRFAAMLQQRQAAGDAAQLAAVLAAASPGRAPSVWQELEGAAAAGSLPPLLLVAGQADAKFVGIAEKLAGRLAAAGSPSGSADEEDEGDWHAAQLPLASGDSASDAHMGGGASVEVALLPGCGHAPHIERPVELLAALQRFLSSHSSM